jgi:KEOPS complex subunit Cgi121
MELVEGVVEVGGERFPDTGAFVDALSEIGEEHGVTVQAFDARYVVSRRHLERALALADRERGRGEAIARDRAVEVLLYAAGRRQIDRALTMGVGEGETPAVVLVDAPDGSEVGGGPERGEGREPEGERERRAATAVRQLLDPTGTLETYDPERVYEFFDIGGAELESTDADVESLVLERVALLVVER